MRIRSKHFFATLLLSVFLRTDAFADLVLPTRSWVFEVADHPFGVAEYPWGTTVYYGWGGIPVEASLFALGGWVSLLAVVSLIGYLFVVRHRAV